MDVKFIVLITNSLDFVRKVVNFLVYSGQIYSLAVCFVFKLFSLAIKLNSEIA